MSKPVFSVVLATYNRPAALQTAIHSVLQQTVSDWEMLVIGDLCDSRTEEAVNSFKDPRIRYVNLPERFGEQSGPNSIGMALARGNHIAFLNHDDVFLQDHFEHALHDLKKMRADLFIGRSLFARNTDANSQPLFTEINPPGRKAKHAHYKNPVLFEPASAWIIRSEAAQKIGHWHAAAAIYRTPAQEWILRAWRHGLRFCFSRTTTVLKIVTHYTSNSKHAYDHPATEHIQVRRLLSTRSADEIRDRFSGNIINDKEHLNLPVFKNRSWFAQKIFLNSVTAFLYRYSSVDAYSFYCILNKIPKGRVLNRAIQLRTGEASLPQPPDIETMLSRIRVGHE